MLKQIFLFLLILQQKKRLGAGYASDLKWIESSARQIAKFSKTTLLLLKKVLPPRLLKQKTILNSSEQNITKDRSLNYEFFNNIYNFLTEGSDISGLFKILISFSGGDK